MERVSACVAGGSFPFPDDRTQAETRRTVACFGAVVSHAAYEQKERSRVNKKRRRVTHGLATALLVGASRVSEDFRSASCLPFSCFCASSQFCCVGYTAHTRHCHVARQLHKSIYSFVPCPCHSVVACKVHPHAAETWESLLTAIFAFGCRRLWVFYVFTIPPAVLQEALSKPPS